MLFCFTRELQSRNCTHLHHACGTTRRVMENKCVLLLLCVTLTAARPPNFVFMMADDLGYGDLHYNYGTAQPRRDGVRSAQLEAGPLLQRRSRVLPYARDGSYGT